MGESRGSVTQSVQNSASSRKQNRNGKRTRNQSYSQDEQDISTFTQQLFLVSKKAGDKGDAGAAEWGAFSPYQTM